MKEKLQALLAKMKQMPSMLMAKMPFPLGICMGYLFHPEIKLALELLSKLAKHL